MTTELDRKTIRIVQLTQLLRLKTRYSDRDGGDGMVAA